MPKRSPLASRAAVLAAVLLIAACDDEPSAPQTGYTIRVQSGNDQFAGFGQELEDPLQVIVENANTGEPASGIVVEWSIVEGSGASLGVSASQTDANGVAATTLELGPLDASYQVRASVEDLVGNDVTFDATAVAPAVLDSVAPASVDAGDTIRIHGHGFATSPGDNTVLIAGFRADVLEASPVLLRVVVPACVPTRTTSVRVDLGIVQSNTKTLDVTGTAAAALEMNVGQVLYLDDAAAAACLRLAPMTGAQYLVVLQNAATVAGTGLEWRLTGAGNALLASRPRTSAFMVDAARAPLSSPQSRIDFELRDLEAAAAARARPLAAASRTPASAAAPPEVGDRRDFWVFRRAGEYVRVSAVVRHVSEHAILYEDVDAPEDGFQPTDFQTFGAIFDDPIYESTTSVYGATSDVDNNDRIVILFTPVVNRLTPAGSGNAFVAGFFFGIDLLDDQPHGNDAEVFYTLVPDPDGEFGNVRTFAQMLQSVPPVMAHEFQHMIHFNQRILLRDASIEQTWLSEGLAHTAEELVADAYAARGDFDRAFDFRVQNYLRADMYLDNTAAVSPLGPAVPLAVRGASWLLLEYLQGHFGGGAFLAELTQTSSSGAVNVAAAAGVDWGTLLHRWAIATWADDAGIPNVDPIYSYTDVNLRQVYENTGFPLLPAPLTWSDFTRTGTLPSAAAQYWILDAGIASAPIAIGVAGRHSPFGASDRPQLSVLRIQ